MPGKRYRRGRENRPAATEHAFRRQFLRNTAASGAANVWAMVAGLVSVPLLVDGLGARAFGAWALVLTFSASNGWGSLADLGIVVAATRRAAARSAKDEPIAPVVTAAALAMAPPAVLAASAMLVLSFPLPGWFGAHTVPGMGTALRFMALQLMVDLAINLIEGVLEGIQRVDLSRAVDMSRRLAVISATAAAALLTGSLARVAAASLGASLMALAVAALTARRQGIGVAPPDEDPRSLLREGRHVALLRPLGVVQRTMDRTLAGLLLGPAAVAVVEIATQLASAAEAVLGASSYSVVPAASWLEARGDAHARSRLRALTVRGTALSMAATFPVAGAVALFAGAFVPWWVGPGFDDAPLLCAIAAAAVAVNAPLAVGSQMLVGIGRAHHVLRAAGVALAVNLVASVALIESVGVAGTFLGTLIANVALLFVLGPRVLDAIRPDAIRPEPADDATSGDVEHPLERHASPR